MLQPLIITAIIILVPFTIIFLVSLYRWVESLRIKYNKLTDKVNELAREINNGGAGQSYETTLGNCISHYESLSGTARRHEKEIKMLLEYLDLEITKVEKHTKLTKKENAK